jgi:ABC-type lipoprotein export system ATPase subunit
MVTHDSAVAAAADRLVQLRDGLVVTDGEPAAASAPPSKPFMEEPA